MSHRPRSRNRDGGIGVDPRLFLVLVFILLVLLAERDESQKLGGLRGHLRRLRCEPWAWSLIGVVEQKGMRAAFRWVAFASRSTCGFGQTGMGESSDAGFSTTTGTLSETTMVLSMETGRLQIELSFWRTSACVSSTMAPIVSTVVPATTTETPSHYLFVDEERRDHIDGDRGDESMTEQSPFLFATSTDYVEG